MAIVTALKQRTKPKARKKARTLRAGEGLNPDNLRYVDPQGMPAEEGGGGLWSQEFKAFLQASTLKGLFFSEDWVFITTDAVAMPISRCPLKVYALAQAEGGKERRDVLAQHAVSRLLATPNKFQSDRELRYSLAVDTVLGGNGFLYHAKELGELHSMPFERVAYRFDGQGLPSHLMFMRQAMDDVFMAEQNGVFVPLDQVIHARRPNPSSAIWGLSPFIPGRKSILFNRYSTDYLLAYYLKGATPQMILEVEQAASQETLVRMIRSFESAYTGRRNQRRTMVLPKGVKATMADTKIADQDFIELTKNNRETVLNLLRVPKHALGLQESGSLGSREHELALRWFWNETIIPTMDLIEGAMTRHFRNAGMLRDNEVIGFDKSNVDVIQEDLLAKAEVSEKLAGIWTPNERREKLFGMPAIPDGDVIPALKPAGSTMPFGLALGSAPEVKTPEGAINPPFKDTVEPLPPVNTETQDELPQNETPDVPGPASKILEKYKSQLKASDDAMVSTEKGVMPKVERQAVDLLISQTEACVKALRSTSKSLTKAVDEEEFKRKMDEALGKLEDDYVNGYRGTLEATVGEGYDAQVSMMFDKKSREALAAYKERDVKGQRQILSERGLFAFKSATATTSDRVAKEVENGLAEGLTVDKIADKIVEYMKGQTRYRANMIARTETLTAFSIGGMATLERAREAIPGLKKMWVTGNDDRVRKEHIELMGEVREADGIFAKGARFPRDPAAQDPGFSINCRCAVLMLPPEDVADYAADIAALPKDPVDVE